MTPPTLGSSHFITSYVRHTVRTLVCRDDMVGWVTSGQKALIQSGARMQFKAGDLFVVPRNTEWDVINDPHPHSAYQARIILFQPALIQYFHQHHALSATAQTLRKCGKLKADAFMQETFMHAARGLTETGLPPAIQKHRIVELLLLLAEQGLVFSNASEMGWADKVRRLVAQRTHVQWTVAQVAEVFHMSASSLQRRLLSEGTTLATCLREVRMNTALSLLQITTLPISDISERCGYNSHSRFTAAFKERFGYLPSYLRSKKELAQIDC